jgi:lambda repressor-like predicted transcriptional regulator
MDSSSTARTDGNALAGHMRRVGLSKAALADRAEVDVKTLTRALHGSTVRRDNVERIAKALGISVRLIIRAEDLSPLPLNLETIVLEHGRIKKELHELETALRKECSERQVSDEQFSDWMNREF